jgi:hypothetical protein
MEIGDEERDIVTLRTTRSASVHRYHHATRTGAMRTSAHLDRLSSQNNEILCTHHHESGEFMTEDTFDIILLLDANRHANRVDRRFDEDLFLFVTRDCEGV